jgi:hypothetical protein
MTSPFKFLEPYGKDDAAFFFGRDKETAQLFNAVHASNLTLLYGASGTGKTSLINCGLANKFYETDWLPLFVRRGMDINRSLSMALDRKLIETEENPERLAITKKVDLLFLDYFKPVYLIFDQFEELFIFGTKDEQDMFYATVKMLLETPQLHVKIIISIREEWIAHLNDFEKIVPYMFDNRLRVERMSYDNLCEVVEGTLHHVGVKIDTPEKTVDMILNNIHDKKDGIALTNLQVYLDRLYRVAAPLKQGDTITFTPSVVEQVGPIENVIDDFLEEELVHIEVKLAEKGTKQAKGLPLEILFALVSDNGTKKPSILADIKAALPQNRGIQDTDIALCLEEFKRIRILRETD